MRRGRARGLVSETGAGRGFLQAGGLEAGGRRGVADPGPAEYSTTYSPPVSHLWVPRPAPGRPAASPKGNVFSSLCHSRVTLGKVFSSTAPSFSPSVKRIQEANCFIHPELMADTYVVVTRVPASVGGEYGMACPMPALSWDLEDREVG